MKYREHSIQVGIVRYLRLNRILCFAIPNGGYRPVKTGAIMRSEGTLAGVADLIIVLDSKVVFVEVKSEHGRQSKEQQLFQLEVERLGHKYLIWRKIDDAVNFVLKSSSPYKP